MEILKGKVQDPGYPGDTWINYGKVDDNTLYYFMPDGELSNGNYIANTNLKEAIGHAPATSLGVIDKDGKILIPFENKTIKKIENDLLLVEKNKPTKESVVALLNSKNNPANNEVLEANDKTKKDQIIQVMGMSGDFLFANQFSEAAIYTYDGLNVANDYYSYIAELNNDYYFTSVEPNSKIIKFNPSMLQQNVEKETPAEVQQPTQQVEDTKPENIPVPEQTEQDMMPNIDIPIQQQIGNGMLNETSTQNIENQSQTEQTNETSNEQSAATKTEMGSIPNIPNVEPNQKEATNEEQQNSAPPVGTDTNQVNNEVDSTNTTESTNNIENNPENDTDATNEVEDTQNEELEDTSDVEDAQEEEIEDTSDKEDAQDEEVEDTDEVEDTKNEEIENTTEEDNQDEEVEDNNQSKKHELTDEDIATPGIQNARLTIINLVTENRKQREEIDDLAGKNAVLDENLKIVREYSEGQSVEIQSLRGELESYRSQLVEEKRKNAKLLIVVDKQNRAIEELEKRNTDLSGQVAGLDELNRAVTEANMLVQPLEQANDSNVIYDKFNYLGNEKGKGKTA